MDISREELTQKLIDKYGYTKQLLDSLNEDDFYDWVERLRDDTIYAIEGAPLDQKAKADKGKLRYTLIPPAALDGIATVREYGCRKYGSPDNWRQVEAHREFDAAIRHIRAMWDDLKATDAESGLLHIDHALTDLAFVRQLIAEGKI